MQPTLAFAPTLEDLQDDDLFSLPILTFARPEPDEDEDTPEEDG